MLSSPPHHCVRYLISHSPFAGEFEELFDCSTYFTQSLPPPKYHFRYGHRSEAACSEIHKSVSGMGNPWSINVFLFLVYEIKDCHTVFPTMKKSHTYLIWGTCRDALRPTQHSYNTESDFAHMLHSRHATLAIQSCEIPQGRHCD
jgi:hypothetical protein